MGQCQHRFFKNKEEEESEEEEEDPPKTPTQTEQPQNLEDSWTFVETESDEDFSDSQTESAKSSRPTTPRTPSEISQYEEVNVGDRLQDDMINCFCTILQLVCPKKIEGMLAMQYLGISEVHEMKQHFPGKRHGLQILYDFAREHYVLLRHDPFNKRVIIYDSLQPYEDNGDPKIIPEISKQIGHLFGHLFNQHIQLLIDKEYEQQNDGFSCGYRCIAALVDLARHRNPAKYTYNLTEILDFLHFIIKRPNPTWKMFENARFGREKEYSGDQRIQCHIENPQYVSRKRKSSSSTETPSTSRTPSTWSSTGSKRASAGQNVDMDSQDPPKYLLDSPKPTTDPENIETKLSSSSSPRPLVSPDDLNLSPSPFVCFKDAFLLIYHTPIAWNIWFSWTEKSDN